MPGNVREIVKESVNRREVKRRRFWWIAIVVLSVGIISGVGYALQQPTWQIRQISLEPDLLDYKTGIKKIITDELAGRWFYVLPRSSVFVASKTDLAKKIWAANPQLTFVSVNIEGQTIVIGGENRHPTALLCNFNNDCYYIDQRGIIYEPGPQSAYYVLPIFQAEFANVHLPDRFLATEDYQALLSTIDRLNQTAANLNLSSAHFRSINLNGDDVAINFRGAASTSTGWQLKFTTGVSADSLQKYLETLVGVKSFKDRLSGGQLSLIDLRFKPKVYYKFK